MKNRMEQLVKMVEQSALSVAARAKTPTELGNELVALKDSDD